MDASCGDESPRHLASFTDACFPPGDADVDSTRRTSSERTEAECSRSELLWPKWNFLRSLPRPAVRRASVTLKPQRLSRLLFYLTKQLCDGFISIPVTLKSRRPDLWQ
ncbi:hypothetical protein F2P81_001128 [Scophthalmus maximus]|uniref:Uncharacterized protein n=1 Tax=Scophthalmus maximus TaxID=52904 RepID=A0A6A4TQA0_SCOMX|nr:hypothetical protein F2P81_001128 [Scophthalmus maximus]